MNTNEPNDTARDGDLAVEIGRVRRSGGLGRSVIIIRLFDYLVEQSLISRSIERCSDK